MGTKSCDERCGCGAKDCDGICGCGFVSCKWWGLEMMSQQLTAKAVKHEAEHGKVDQDLEDAAELAFHASCYYADQCDRQMQYTTWRKDMLRTMARTRPSFEQAIAEGIAQMPAAKAARGLVLLLSAVPVGVSRDADKARCVTSSL
mgnify:FL=1